MGERVQDREGVCEREGEIRREGVGEREGERDCVCVLSKSAS